VKEMTGTAALAVGPGGGPEDPEDDEHGEGGEDGELDEIKKLRELIQKTINELDYTSDPETEEVSARTAMKAAVGEKLEEELEEEENLKEVRKFVNQIIREQEETYEEDSMVPEDPEPMSKKPNTPLNMLKELMLADIEEFGRVKSSFEQY